MIATVDREDIKRIYHEYLTAYFNEKYYAHRLTIFSRLNDTYEAVLAIGASSTIGSWSVWSTSGTVAMAWAVFGGVVALLVVLKPFFRLAQKAERSGKLYVGYKGLRFDLENLVGDIKGNDFALTAEAQVLFNAARRRYQTLALEDEVTPSRKLMAACQASVRQELPDFDTWCP